MERLARSLASRNVLLERIAMGGSLVEVLDLLAREAELVSPAMLCSVLLLDREQRTLHHGAAPSLPEAYCRAIDGLAIGEGRGSCGSAAHSGERVLVEDVMTHPWWADYRALAADAGLRACWSEPIRDTHRAIVGTFAMYYREPRAPSEEDIALIATWAHIAGIAIERAHVEAELARYRDHLEELVAQRTVELRAALDDVKVLRGFLPICAWCRRVRDDGGYWDQIEAYISARSEATFTHGICPDCATSVRRTT